MKFRPLCVSVSLALRLALLAGSASTAVAAHYFTTLAGTAGAVVNSIDATGSAAQFDTPRGVAVDSSGNLYVADSSNHTIRKVTAAGVVTTLAGTAGSSGRTDGTGAAARFNEPFGLVVDGSGTVYVADSSSSAIRRITAAGVVTTFAGGGLPGSADGTGTAASLHEPHAVALDSAGNLYVADYENNIVRKITSLGVVTTLAGTANAIGSTDGTGAAARFTALHGIVVDSTGNVFVADGGNRNIRKITPAGVVTTFAGLAGASGFSDGTGTAARFGGPRGLAIDSADNIYVADYGAHIIRKITPAAVVTTIAGTAPTPGSTDGTGTAARFNSPSGIAVDTAGNLYVADMENDAIRKITSAGVVTTLAGLAGRSSSADGSGGAARFEDPYAVTVDSSGNTYIADSGAHCIRKVTAAGVVTTLAGLAGTFGSAEGAGTAARFYSPLGVAVDSAGNVYIADSGNHTVRKITPAGVVSTLAGTAGLGGGSDGTGAAARFNEPHGIAVDSAGNVYVADSASNTLRKITAAGVVTTLAGTGTPGSADGTGTAASFTVPYGVTVDTAGNIYVCDHGNHTIRKVTAAGVVTTLAGTAGSPGSTDGTGTAARFKYPSDVTVDSLGNVYVADTDNQVIRQVTSAGVVTTIAGTGTVGSTDGLGTAAKFYNPKGIAVDSSGNLYIADRSNHTIRKGTVAVATTITTQPVAQTAVAGSALTLTVVASGTPAPTSYQWYRDSTAITGATSATYTVAVTTATDAGSYTCVVGNGVATATTTAVVVTITVNSRVVNLSVRSAAGSGSQTLIVGFVITGAGNKALLLRGMGPALLPFGVVTAMTDPILRLYNGAGTAIDSNDDWGGSVAMTNRFNALVGWVPAAASKDAALYSSTIASGAYTFHVVANTGSPGVALAELYDADTVEGTAKVVNISARTQVGTGENILIAGFVITGTTSKTMLLRGVGPTLTGYGVEGALADPQLHLYQASTLVGTNNDWAGTQTLKDAFTTVGAVALVSDTSKDAALLVTLAPGIYSAQVSGTASTTGVALVEIFLLP